jgi:hypothetical protein
VPVPDKTEKAEKTEKAAESPKVDEPYVSHQVAVKTWSIVARFLHEGAGMVTLHKAWDSRNREIILFPSYSGQDPEALKPDVWTVWRHELKPPLGGHTYIRDYARVQDAIPLQSKGALRLVDADCALNLPEAMRRFEHGTPGLVAVFLRVYHLPRAYKFYDVAEKEGPGEFVPLPYDVLTEGSTPAVSDADFERRMAAILRALGRE